MKFNLFNLFNVFNQPQVLNSLVLHKIKIKLGAENIKSHPKHIKPQVLSAIVIDWLFHLKLSKVI